MAASGPTHARSGARAKLVQALYQHAVSGHSAEEIDRQFLAEGLGDIDVAYFREAIRAVIERIDELDARIAACLDRPIAQLDPVERSILRLGAYELSDRYEIPYRVVIDEAVELARAFGAEASYRYINGVLDRLGGELPMRAAERQGKGAGVDHRRE